MNHYHRSLILVICLLWMTHRGVKAEDRLDLSFGYYLEDHHRVEVWSPVLLWEADVAPNSVIRLQAVYDVVSGASPTGAPLTQRTKEVVSTVFSTSYNVVSGPSGRSSTLVPVTSSTQQTTLVPYGKPYLPMHEFEDQRLGLNLELENRIGDWLLNNSVSYGQESDYLSLAGTVKVGREFNKKQTLLNTGFSFGRDWVQNPVLDRRNGKDSVEGLLGLVQVINPTTLLTINGSIGSAAGYLNDQYKYASVADEIIPEKRPDQRDRRAVFVMLNHMFTSLDGSLEGSYRYYTDSFGIDSNTYGLAWYQNIGKHWVVSPSVRYYEQSAADFYAPLFLEKQPYYSADYRLANLMSITYGLKVIWKASDKVQLSLAFDRYTMNGLDHGLTPIEAFPSANIITAGVKIWF